MSENQKGSPNNKPEDSGDKYDKFVEHIGDLIESIQPYDRAVLEKMTRKEQRAYNIGYGAIGVLCLICAALDGLWNLIAGNGHGVDGVFLIAGAGCLLYYWNPFCYANLWKCVKKAIRKIHK